MLPPPPITGMPVGNLALAIAIQKATERSAHFLASGTALFAYDWALTLSDDIRYIWQSNFTLVKMLFIANRFLTLFVLIIMNLGGSGLFANSVPQCKVIAASAGVLTGVLFTIWNWVLAIRVYALWGLKPQMKYFIATCWILSSACALSLNIRAITWMIPRETTILDLKTCVPGALLDHLYIMWIPGLCYETVLFVMAMTKLLAMNMRSSGSLRMLLLRDGVLHYAALTTARVANLAVYIVGDPLTIFIVVFLTIGLGSTMISRMILNLRAWNHSEEENDEMHGMVDLAARRTVDDRPGKSSDRFTRIHTRQESTDRGVSVWIDRPQRQPRLWGGGAGPSSYACDRGAPMQTESDRGVSMHTEVVTIVDSPHPFVAIDTTREPTPPSREQSLHL